MAKVLRKIVVGLPPERQGELAETSIEGTPVWVMNLFGFIQLHIGVKKNELIIAQGRYLFEKAMFGSNKGILERHPNLFPETGAKNAHTLFYLDIAGVSKAVGSFFSDNSPKENSNPQNGPSAMKRIGDAGGNFDSLLITSSPEKDAIKGELLIKTRFRDSFFRGLKTALEVVREKENDPGSSKK